MLHKISILPNSDKFYQVRKESYRYEKMPICNQNITNVFCGLCGFDETQNYTRYATFAPIAVTELSYKAVTDDLPENDIDKNNVSTQTADTLHAPIDFDAKNKWVAFFLCLFLGNCGVHKFYEGRIAMGVVYLCTGGLCGIGWLVDCICLLFKSNPYYVKK